MAKSVITSSAVYLPSGVCFILLNVSFSLIKPLEPITAPIQEKAMATAPEAYETGQMLIQASQNPETPITIWNYLASFPAWSWFLFGGLIAIIIFSFLNWRKL